MYPTCQRKKKTFRQAEGFGSARLFVASCIAFYIPPCFVSFSCDVCVRRAVSGIVGSFGFFNVLPVQVIASVLRLEAVERFVKRTILR